MDNPEQGTVVDPIVRKLDASVESQRSALSAMEKMSLLERVRIGLDVVKGFGGMESVGEVSSKMFGVVVEEIGEETEFTRDESEALIGWVRGAINPNIKEIIGANESGKVAMGLLKLAGQRGEELDEVVAEAMKEMLLGLPDNPMAVVVIDCLGRLPRGVASKVGVGYVAEMNAREVDGRVKDRVHKKLVELELSDEAGWGTRTFDEVVRKIERNGTAGLYRDRGLVTLRQWLEGLAGYLGVGRLGQYREAQKQLPVQVIATSLEAIDEHFNSIDITRRVGQLGESGWEMTPGEEVRLKMGSDMEKLYFGILWRLNSLLIDGENEGSWLANHGLIRALGEEDKLGETIGHLVDWMGEAEMSGNLEKLVLIDILQGIKGNNGEAVIKALSAGVAGGGMRQDKVWDVMSLFEQNGGWRVEDEVVAGKLRSFRDMLSEMSPKDDEFSLVTDGGMAMLRNIARRSGDAEIQWPAWIRERQEDKMVAKLQARYKVVLDDSEAGLLFDEMGPVEMAMMTRGGVIRLLDYILAESKDEDELGLDRSVAIMELESKLRDMNRVGIIADNDVEIKEKMDQLAERVIDEAGGADAVKEGEGEEAASRVIGKYDMKDKLEGAMIELRDLRLMGKEGLKQVIDHIVADVEKVEGQLGMEHFSKIVATVEVLRAIKILESQGVITNEDGEIMEGRKKLQAKIPPPKED